MQALASGPSTEVAAVLVWRREYAQHLGFDFTEACKLAETTIDLHAVEALTERGCAPSLAVRIVG